MKRNAVCQDMINFQGHGRNGKQKGREEKSECRSLSFSTKKQVTIMDRGSRNFSFSTKKQVNATDKDDLIGRDGHYVLKLIDIISNIRYSSRNSKTSTGKWITSLSPKKRSFLWLVRGPRDKIHFTCWVFL